MEIVDEVIDFCTFSGFIVHAFHICSDCFRDYSNLRHSKFRKWLLKLVSGPRSIPDTKLERTTFYSFPRTSARIVTISMAKFDKERFETSCTDVFFVSDYDMPLIGEDPEWYDDCRFTRRALPIRYNLITRQMSMMHQQSFLHGLFDACTEVKASIITDNFRVYYLLQLVIGQWTVTLNLSTPTWYMTLHGIQAWETNNDYSIAVLDDCLYVLAKMDVNANPHGWNFRLVKFLQQNDKWKNATSDIRIQCLHYVNFSSVRQCNKYLCFLSDSEGFVAFDIQSATAEYIRYRDPNPSIGFHVREFFYSVSIAEGSVVDLYRFRYQPDNLEFVSCKQVYASYLHSISTLNLESMTEIGIPKNVARILYSAQTFHRRKETTSTQLAWKICSNLTVVLPSYLSFSIISSFILHYLKVFYFD